MFFRFTTELYFYSVVVNNINNRNNNNNDNNNANNNNQISTMEANTSIDQKVSKRKRGKRDLASQIFRRNKKSKRKINQFTYKQLR